MKTFVISTVIAVVAIVLYFAGYWVFIQNGLVNRLPFPYNDPFVDSGPQKIIRGVFGPAQKAHYQWGVYRPLKRYLTGDWESSAGAEFVRIDRDGQCSFKLGRFEYSGTIQFEKGYGGYSTEFSQNGKTFFFIISIIDDDRSVKKATAFIGHDIRQYFDQNLIYEVKLSKRVE